MTTPLERTLSYLFSLRTFLLLLGLSVFPLTEK